MISGSLYYEFINKTINISYIPGSSNSAKCLPSVKPRQKADKTIKLLSLVSRCRSGQPRRSPPKDGACAFPPLLATVSQRCRHHVDVGLKVRSTPRTEKHLSRRTPCFPRGTTRRLGLGVGRWGKEELEELPRRRFTKLEVT